MKAQVTALAALLVVGSTSFAFAQSGGAMSGDAMKGDAMKSAGVPVKFAAQNGSGETGTATLAQDGENIKVTIAVSGGNAKGPQPVHIHDGTCANLNPKPAFPLTAIVDGKSTTTLTPAQLKGTTLADLQNGKYAINVHKSTDDIATYVACGDIPKK